MSTLPPDERDKLRARYRQYVPVGFLAGSPPPIHPATRWSHERDLSTFDLRREAVASLKEDLGQINDLLTGVEKSTLYGVVQHLDAYGDARNAIDWARYLYAEAKKRIDGTLETKVGPEA